MVKRISPIGELYLLLAPFGKQNKTTTIILRSAIALDAIKERFKNGKKNIRVCINKPTRTEPQDA